MPEIGVLDPVTPKKNRISTLRQETGVDIAYGEKSWRPVQSVIDLVQNHLDAQAAVYETRLVGALGVEIYETTDHRYEAQRKELDKLIAASYDPDSQESSFTFVDFSVNLEIQQGIDLRPNEIKALLSEVEFIPPKIKVKLKRDEETKLVDYTALEDEPEEWQISGFRIEDEGSGFDHRFLGIMGGTTKKEIKTRRGGLGEGLKMSVTHLVRSGAEVRLLSRNEEELWVARPKNENDSVVFEGKSRIEDDPPSTGSTTDVDFSSSSFDPKLKRIIVNALDPRIGEGLGKYILDYRDPKFIPLVNRSVALASEGLPGGRIYVKGLLVEEATDILWSYNTGEKWAINGRDRKTVDRAKVKNLIIDALEELDDPALMGELLSAVRVGEKNQEISLLSRQLDIGEKKQEKWRTSFERVFSFTPGKTLFAGGEIRDFSQIRYAESLGYRVIKLPEVGYEFTQFLDSIYPSGTVVTLQELMRKRDLSVEKGLKEGGEIGGEFRDSLTNFTTHFTGVLRDAGFYGHKMPMPEPDENPSDFAWRYHDAVMESPFCLERLEALHFIYDPEGENYEGNSNFSYNFNKNTILVRENLSQLDFQDVADLYIQLVKTYVGRDSFNTETQAVMTRLAGDSVALLRPELLSELGITLSESIGIGGRDYYTDDLRDADESLISYYVEFQRLNKLDLSKKDVEEILTDLRNLGLVNFVGGNPKKNGPTVGQTRGINTTIYMDGRVYDVRPADLSLREVKTGNFQEGELLYKYDNYILGTESSKNGTFKITEDDIYYLPFVLQKGVVVQFKFVSAGEESVVQVKRRGNEILATKTYKEITEVLTLNSAVREFDFFGASIFSVHNNVLRIVPSENQQVSVEYVNSAVMQTKPEVNQGKDFLTSKITIDYGGRIWADPRRMLIDAIQNHIDAGKDVPQVLYTVANMYEGNISRVGAEELRSMGAEWRIIGFEVSDTGKGFSTPYLTNLGSSTKGDEQIGKFGEGLKMLAGSALKLGIKMQLESRDWVAEPVIHKSTARDYEKGEEKEFEILGFNMRWNDTQRAGSSTAFSAFSLGPNQTELSEDQLFDLDELFDDGFLEGDIWSKWVNELDPRVANEFGQSGIEKLILPRDISASGNNFVRVFPQLPGMIYEKGLLVPRDEYSKKYMFGYDFSESIINTRERNAYNQELLDGYFKYYFTNLTDTRMMREILIKAHDNPGINFHEYKFLFNPETGDLTKKLWRKTFYETFGKDAILSLRSEFEELLSYQAKGDEPMEGSRLFRVGAAVKGEVHLEKANLIHVPKELTRVLSSVVYDSDDFIKELDSMDVELSPADHEKLFQYVQEANTIILGILDSLDFDQKTKAYLNSTLQAGNQRLEVLARTKANDIHVKSSLYPVNGSVTANFLGGGIDVSLNQDLISNPQSLVRTYTHEAAHYISGSPDYILNFQRMLMAIASLKAIPTAHQRNVMQMH